MNANDSIPEVAITTAPGHRDILGWLSGFLLVWEVA